MDWESKFSSIVRETETNLARVRDRLGSGRGKPKAFPDRSSGNHFGGNLHSQATRSPFQSSVAWDLPSSLYSPVKTVGMATSVPSSQASPALVNALFERVEEQTEMVNQLSDAVKKLLKEKDVHAAEIKKMKDEINRLNDRLRERGVDLETERKLEQFKRDVFSQLDMVRNQTKLSPDAAGNNSRYINDSVVMNEAKRIIEEETESLQRNIEHLKTRLGKMELELHSTVADSRDVLYKQERLDKALSSLSENQRSQSRSLSSIVDERQSDSYEIQQLKHLVNKVSNQYSELETELQSSIRQSGVSSSNSSLRQVRPRSTNQTTMTNGASKPKKKAVKQKSKGASDDLVLSSSSDSDLSLTTLDASSPSDTDLTSLQLDRSYAGTVPKGGSGNGIGNISSSSLSSLDSDDLLK